MESTAKKISINNIPLVTKDIEIKVLSFQPAIYTNNSYIAQQQSIALIVKNLSRDVDVK
jgi:hypothetical protein